MARVDTDALLSRVNITDIIAAHIGPLKRRGNELYGQCPFHDDKHASLQVNESKQIFKCFVDGAGGDAIAFLMELGYTFKEAVAEIEGKEVQASGEAKQRAVIHKPEARPTWKQLKPTAEDCNRAQFSHYRYGEPSKVWKYTDKAGSTLGYVCRFDLGEGKKDVLPFVFATDGKRSEWRWQGFDKPRPLYGLDRLAAAPDKTVILVEGEKTADAVQAHISTGVVVAWPGGSQAIAHIDWTPLHGRKVVLWPDNDQPGDSAMLHVAQLLSGKVEFLKWVQNEPGLPKGWDGADREWEGNDAKKYVLQNLKNEPPAPLSEVPSFLINGARKPATVWQHTPREGEAVHYSARYDVTGGFEWRFVKEPEQPTQPAPQPAPEPEPEPPKPADPEPPVAPPEPPPEDDNGGIEQDYFSFLGYSRGDGTATYHFFAHTKKIIISLAPSSMSKSNLMELAPLQWWENNFPGRSGMSVELAINWLINTSSGKGMFSEKHIRGRGAWIDKGRVVLHEGDYMIVDGIPVSMGGFQSRYIYERGEPLGFQTANPLSNKEANKLIEVVTLLNWEREINAYLLAGWCIVAPICGALNWRPHIWLTGAAGTGKSWLFKNLVRRLLGETSLAVQGETSEAGLRQILQHDALPIVFDEAEGEDRKAQDRMQSVLSLMRAASADDGGIMAKGTSSGAAKTYRIRSCFAFASIAVQVAQQSDRTRVSVLGLKKNNSAEGDQRWKELQAKYAETITDEFVARLQARTVSLIPVILDNARIFAAAGAAEIGEQRTGDQLGALLAGAYSLFSSERITYQKAVEWIRARDWSEEKGLDKTRDEVALLAFLMEQMTTVESGSGTKYDRTVGELVNIADGRKVATDSLISPETANEKLKRLGLKVEGSYLYVSNTAEWIKKTLRDSSWGKNHNKILQRLDKSEAVEPTRFGPGPSARAVRVPLNIVLDDAK